VGGVGARVGERVREERREREQEREEGLGEVVGDGDGVGTNFPQCALLSIDVVVHTLTLSDEIPVNVNWQALEN
jgi:hypothetical protein